MSPDSNYFEDSNVPEDERRDIAFQTLNAIRESVTLAKNSILPITYEFAFDIIHDLDPKLYDAIINLLTKKSESEDVRYYKEVAEATSTEENPVSPVDLIEIDLNRNIELLALRKGKGPVVQKRIFMLQAAKEYFTPREQSEHKSLNHDFYLKSREEYFGKPIYENDNYKDYKISNNKYLRLRLLHPDKEEAILGVDLVYEHFDMIQNTVRFAHMQYKAWNNNIFYFSQSQNFKEQITKMHASLCKSGFCSGPVSEDREAYRFPYCSGFLRPTSKMQKPDSKLITTGAHIPICEVIKIMETDNKLSKENIKDRSIKAHIFEELFITNLLGSRSISIEKLDEFYSSKGILSNLNTIRVHAQEIDVVYDSQKQGS